MTYNNAKWILPNWQVPPAIKAVSTTRQGGVSQAPFNDFNLAHHVGDEITAVNQNRQILKQSLKLTKAPIWLNQVHENKVVLAEDTLENCPADGMITQQKQQVCAVMTADCLPVLLTNQQGNQVAAAHAGWRGLAKGILQETVNQFNNPANEMIVWLGPAIGQTKFEVGFDVFSAFTQQNKQFILAFEANRPHHWLLDIRLLAHFILKEAGVELIYANQQCTYLEEDQFFSYRRNKTCGRMATLIWID